MTNFKIFTATFCLGLYVSHINGSTGESTVLKSKISNHPVIILATFDGFRYDYMSKTSTPNLEQLKAAGVSTPYVMNQFPTKTYPNHHSIATGLHTESHGITDNSVFDTQLNKTLGIRNEEFYNYRNDVLPLWTLNELAGDGRYSGAVMWAGSEFPFGRKRTMPTHLMKYGSIPFETRVDTVMNWITNTTHPANLVFMYFNEPDNTGHENSPESEAIIKAIRQMDTLTGYLVNKLKELEIYDAINLILMSDHGMIEVPKTACIDLDGIISKSLYDIYGNAPSPVYHIKPRSGQLEKVYNAFRTASKTYNFKIYKRKEINTLQPHWFFQNNKRRIMPLIIVADPGYIFKSYVRYPDYPDCPIRAIGAHGYDNNERSMHPFFIAHGPLFQSGATVPPFYNIDLFPLISQLLKIPVAPNNGTVNNVLSLLK